MLLVAHHEAAVPNASQAAVFEDPSSAREIAKEQRMSLFTGLQTMSDFPCFYKIIPFVDGMVIILFLVQHQ